LSPNQSRNLSLRDVHTKYVVFLDNDALVAPRWLESLIQCAEETGAWIVGPLYLYGEFQRAIIHMAGGRLQMEEREGKRVLSDEQYLFDTPLHEAPMSLTRRACDYVEFHCMLVRTDVFERLGPMDEQLLSLQEERDLCLTVLRAGGSVYVEPKAVVTFVPPPPCEWWDLPFFMLRWSEAWNLASVRHFNAKWDIAAVRHIKDMSNSDEEDSIIGFGRSWRRRVAGLKVRPDDTVDVPRLPSEEAELMTALFQSVDSAVFDLALSTDNGEIVESVVSLVPHELLGRLPDVLQRAEENHVNVMIRPVDQARPHDPQLIRLDNLGSEDLHKVSRSSFMTLETSPNQYQCWLAVDKKDWSNASLLRAEAETSVNEFVPLAGSKSVGSQFRRLNGQYPRVRLVEGVAGLLATPRQLQGADLQPFLTARATRGSI
jgi:hypothetical protein